MKDKLIQLNTMFLGNWNGVFDGIRNKLLLKDKKIKNTTPWQTLRFCSINDYDYPEKIKDTIMPPFVLFYEGNWNLINKTLYGIHGKIKYEQIKNIYPDKNKCLMFIEQDYSESLEQFLLKNKIEHVVVFDKKIDKEIKNPGCQLFISKFYTNITNPTIGQNASRIVLGLSVKNIFVNDAIYDTREISYFDVYKSNLAILWDTGNYEDKYSKLLKIYKNIDIEIIDNLKSWFSKK